MDCEKFDQHVIDALYDELDELTRAALVRHVEGRDEGGGKPAIRACPRCAAVYGGLRATRAVAVLPLEEPPDDLEDRILAAVARVEAPAAPLRAASVQAAAAHAVVAAPPPSSPASLLPASRKGAIAWLLRPQLAMAAALLLVVGSGIFLVQGSRKAPASATAERASAPAATAASAPPPAPAAVGGLDQGQLATASPPPTATAGVEESPAATATAAVAVAEASAAPSSSAARDAGAAPAAVAAARAPARLPAAKPAADLANAYIKPGDAPIAGPKPAQSPADQGAPGPRTPAAPVRSKSALAP
jgi:hypothetical protein